MVLCCEMISLFTEENRKKIHFTIVYLVAMLLSFCFQLEAIVVEMQSGVKGSEQKLNVTTIPHVVAGMIQFLKDLNRFKVHRPVSFHISCILKEIKCYQLYGETKSVCAGSKLPCSDEHTVQTRLGR